MDPIGLPTELHTLLTTAGVEAEPLQTLGEYWTIVIGVLFIAGMIFLYTALRSIYDSLKYNDRRIREGFQWRWIGGVLLANFSQFLTNVLSLIYT